MAKHSFEPKQWDDNKDPLMNFQSSDLSGSSQQTFLLNLFISHLHSLPVWEASAWESLTNILSAKKTDPVGY